MSSQDARRIIDRGKRVLALERDALAATTDRLGDQFANAVQLLRDSGGRVIVSGVGKSGLIARKIAATFTSTGTPASGTSAAPPLLRAVSVRPRWRDAISASS